MTSVADILRKNREWMKSKELLEAIVKEFKITERQAYRKIEDARDLEEIRRITLPDRGTVYGLPQWLYSLKEETKDNDKHAFKLAVRHELQELLRNISNSKGYRLFYSKEWLAHIPSKRRLLLDTDDEWEQLNDFYSKLEKRNEYAFAYQPYDPAITKSGTMAKLDKQCVDAGLKALKEIERDR